MDCILCGTKLSEKHEKAVTNAMLVKAALGDLVENIQPEDIMCVSDSGKDTF